MGRAGGSIVPARLAKGSAQHGLCLSRAGSCRAMLCHGPMLHVPARPIIQVMPCRAGLVKEVNGIGTTQSPFFILVRHSLHP